MAGALILVVIFGVCLPVAAWSVSRRNIPRKDRSRGYDEIDRWLLDEFHLDWLARSRVRTAVSKGQDVSPALEAPARGLATQILAGGFRTMRLSRWAGWIQLASGAVYGVTGIIVCVRSSLQVDGVTAIAGSGLLIFAGAYFALRQPRRVRQNAERMLGGKRPADDGHITK